MNTSKKYTISELYNEWKSKEEIGIKIREKFQRGQYEDEELVLTTTFLKKTADSILFGQYPIEDNYTIKKEETNYLFFHFKFAENLGFADNQEMLLLLVCQFNTEQTFRLNVHAL